MIFAGKKNSRQVSRTSHEKISESINKRKRHISFEIKPQNNDLSANKMVLYDVVVVAAASAQAI